LLLPISLQIHCLQFLICELVSGGNMRKPGGLFGNSGSGIPVEDLKQLETFFYKLSFFLHILDYTGAYLSIVNLRNSNLHALSAAYISYVSYFALVEIFSLPSFYYSKVTNLDLRNSYLQFVYFIPLDCEINCYLFWGCMQRPLVL